MFGGRKCTHLGSTFLKILTGKTKYTMLTTALTFRSLLQKPLFAEATS